MALVGDVALVPQVYLLGQKNVIIKGVLRNEIAMVLFFLKQLFSHRTKQRFCLCEIYKYVPVAQLVEHVRSKIQMPGNIHHDKKHTKLVGMTGHYLILPPLRTLLKKRCFKMFFDALVP